MRGQAFLAQSGQNGRRIQEGYRIAGSDALTLKPASRLSAS